MKTLILTAAEKLPESRETLKEHMGKQDILYVITETGMIPVSCYRDMAALPCKVDFITASGNDLASAVHLLIGLSAKTSTDGIFVAGPMEDSLFLPEGIGVPNVKTGASCSILTGDKGTKSPAKRTRKKAAAAQKTEKNEGKAESAKAEPSQADEEKPHKAEKPASKPEPEPKPMEPGDMNEPELSDSPAPESGGKRSRFANLLYAYCGGKVDIGGRENEIETAVSKCMSEVSLDMMIRMYVQPEIDGLYDVVKQHYKELKAACG